MCLEFGPGSYDSSMIDACGVERQAYSKEAPGKSPIINSSEDHEGTGPCPKHHSGKHSIIVSGVLGVWA